MTNKKSIYAIFGAISLLPGILIYFLFGGNFFTSMDVFSLIEYGKISSYGDIIRIFSTNMMKNTGFSGNYYRPLSSLTFSIDYSLFGLRAHGYYITNSILLSFCTFCILLYSRTAYTSDILPFLAVFIFLTYPVLVNVVPSISRRQDIIFSALFLLCLIFLFKYIQEGGIYNLTFYLVFIFLSSLSKETFASILIFTFAYTFLSKFYLKDDFRNSICASLYTLALFVAYVMYRLFVVGSAPAPSGGALDILGITRQIFNSLYTFAVSTIPLYGKIYSSFSIFAFSISSILSVAALFKLGNIDSKYRYPLIFFLLLAVIALSFSPYISHSLTDLVITERDGTVSILSKIQLGSSENIINYKDIIRRTFHVILFFLFCIFITIIHTTGIYRDSFKYDKNIVHKFTIYNFTLLISLGAFLVLLRVSSIRSFFVVSILSSILISNEIIFISRRIYRDSYNWKFKVGVLFALPLLCLGAIFNIKSGVYDVKNEAKSNKIVINSTTRCLSGMRIGTDIPVVTLSNVPDASLVSDYTLESYLRLKKNKNFSVLVNDSKYYENISETKYKCQHEDNDISIAFSSED